MKVPETFEELCKKRASSRRRDLEFDVKKLFESLELTARVSLKISRRNGFNFWEAFLPDPEFPPPRALVQLAGIRLPDGIINSSRL
jgi:hypothetical protein